MKSFKKFLLIIFCNILLVTNLNSKEVPDSFADLVEKLIPSVVNISATRVIETRPQNPFPFQFPPGHPFEDYLKILIEAEAHKKENHRLWAQVL